MKVEFVSYSGAYPNLCSGTLIVRIEGVEHAYSRCLIPGGSCGFDANRNERITRAPWKGLDRYNVPSWIFETEGLEAAILEAVNANVPWGCCGGCL